MTDGNLSGPPKLSLGQRRLLASWKDLDETEQLAKLREVRQDELPSSVPLIMDLIEHATPRARDNILNLIKSVPFARRTAFDRTLISAGLVEAKASLSARESLATLAWMTEELGANPDGAAKSGAWTKERATLLLPLFRLASTQLAELDPEARAVVRSGDWHGFRALIHIAVLDDDMETLRRFLRADAATAAAALDRLDDWTGDAHQDQKACAATKAFPATLDCLLEGGKDTLGLLWKLRGGWLKRLLADDLDETLSVLGERCAASKPQRTLILALACEKIDALEAKLSAQGRPLFTDRVQEFPELARLDALTPYAWLQRMLPGVADTDLPSFAKVVLAAAKAIAHKGSGASIPIIKLIYRDAGARLEHKPHDPELWRVFDLVRTGWPDVEHQLYAIGNLQRGDHLAGTVLSELDDLVSQATKRRDKADESVCKAAAAAEATEKAKDARAEAGAQRTQRDLQQKTEMTARQTEQAVNLQKQADTNAQRLLLTTQFQQDVAALMARTDLSPAAKSAALQAATQAYQQKMATLS